MKKTFLFIAMLAGWAVMAQNTNQVTTTDEKIENIETLLNQLTEKIEALEKNPDRFKYSKLGQLAVALDSLNTGTFTKIVKGKNNVNDKVTKSYSVTITSDNLAGLENVDTQELQDKLAQVLKELQDSEAMIEVINKLANSDLAKELAKKKKD